MEAYRVSTRVNNPANDPKNALRGNAQTGVSTKVRLGAELRTRDTSEPLEK